MALISIGRAQRLLASLVQLHSCGSSIPGHTVHLCKFITSSCPFLPLSSLCPFWLAHPMQIRLFSTVRTNSYSLPTHLGSYGHIVWGQLCPSVNQGAIATCCQPPQDTKLVVSTGAGELPLCILAAWTGWVAGSAKSSTKKTLSSLSFPVRRKLVGQLFFFLHEVHVTLMPCPSWHYWLPRLAVAPLCGILEDRIGLVPPGHDILGQQMAL